MKNEKKRRARRLNRAGGKHMKTYTYRQLWEKMEQMGRPLICVLISHLMCAALAEPGKAPDCDDIVPDEVVKFCMCDGAERIVYCDTDSIIAVEE